jgi:hypothetical protein
MNVLICNINKYEISPSVSLQIINAFVGSIINYACQVWGFTKSKDIERLNLKFCSVKISSGNAAIYGKLGRYPLYVNRYTHIIKYWFKVIHSSNIIVKCVYINTLNLCKKGIKTGHTK